MSNQDHNPAFPTNNPWHDEESQSPSQQGQSRNPYSQQAQPHNPWDQQGQQQQQQPYGGQQPAYPGQQPYGGQQQQQPYGGGGYSAPPGPPPGHTASHPSGGPGGGQPGQAVRRADTFEETDFIPESQRGEQREAMQQFEMSRAGNESQQDRDVAQLQQEFPGVDGSLIAALYSDSGNMGATKEMLMELSSQTGEGQGR